MNKIALNLAVIIFLSAAGTALAEDWDSYNGVDRIWDGQKSITNKEFETVMDALEQKNKQKEEKIRKKKIKKISGGGESLYKELSPDNIENAVQEFDVPQDDGGVINLPVDLIADGKILEKGYYKVVFERDENKTPYIMFYQSSYLMGKLQVNETKDDFGEETVDFAKILPYNDSFVKLIFGSIKANAYAYVPYIRE